MEKSKIAKVVSVMLKLLLICGIIALPFLAKLYDIFKIEGVLSFSKQHFFYQLGFYNCFIVCLVILFFLIKIFNLVYAGSPFKNELVVYLKVIAVLFMALALIVAIKTIFIPTILSGAVILVTFVCSLSFYVLSSVFKVACFYKQEIDYVV